jgi:hypothetical protein
LHLFSIQLFSIRDLLSIVGSTFVHKAAISPHDQVLVEESEPR